MDWQNRFLIHFAKIYKSRVCGNADLRKREKKTPCVARSFCFIKIDYKNVKIINDYKKDIVINL